MSAIVSGLSIGGAAVVGYVVVSVIFLKFPVFYTRCKRKQIAPDRLLCKHISHRGGAGERLENSLEAFQHSYEVGTEMFEIDCQLTADGFVVISHDDDLTRSCGVQKLISQTNYSELPLLKKSLRLDFDPNFAGYQSSSEDSRRILLLRDLFDKFPAMPINIDIKRDSDELIEKVASLIEEYDRVHLTIWGNRSATIVDKCYARNKNIATIFSIRRVVVLVLLFYTGLLPFIPVRERFLEIPMPCIFLKFPIISSDWRFRLIARFVNYLMVSPVLFKHLYKRGIYVYVWVLNEVSEFDLAFKVGATGIMTDFPTLLKDYLAEKDQ